MVLLRFRGDGDGGLNVGRMVRGMGSGRGGWMEDYPGRVFFIGVWSLKWDLLRFLWTAFVEVRMVPEG